MTAPKGTSTQAPEAALEAPRSTEPTALSAPPSVETFIHAIKRRWPLVLVAGAIATIVGVAIVCAFVPAEYTVQVLLHLGGKPTNNALEQDGEAAVYQRTQAALLISYPVLHAALEKPEVAQLPIVRAQADPYDWLSKAIKTDVLLGPEVLRATLSASDGEQAALVLNEVTKAYLKEITTKEENKVRERIRQLQVSFKQHSEMLRDKRQEYLARLSELGMDDPDTVKAKWEALMRALDVLQTQRLKIGFDRKEAEIELANFKARVDDPNSIVITLYAVEQELKNDEVLKKVYLRLAELDEKVVNLERISAGGVGAGGLRALAAERKVIQDRLAAQFQAMRPGVEAKLRSKLVEEAKEGATKQERKIRLLDEQARSLDEQIRKKEQAAASLRNSDKSLDRSARGIDSLKDEVTALEQVMTHLGADLATLEAMLPLPPRVSVVEPAKAPLSKKRDRQLKYAAAGGMGMLLLAVVGVSMFELRSRRIYTSEDVSRGLGMELLGTLPEVPESARQVMPSEATDASQVALIEAVDSVRVRLFHEARAEGLKVIMVASAQGGEGKTSLASHLAASLARGRRKTLLIDADLRDPSAHLPFGLPVAPGFAEGLRGEAAWEGLVQPTSVPGLDLLAAGNADRKAIDGLSQEGLGEVIDFLKGDYDFVVIDSCPVLPVADALLIGRHADAVVFSVLRNVSRLPAVYAAQRRLESLDIPMLGAVVVGEAIESYGVERYGAQAK